MYGTIRVGNRQEGERERYFFKHEQFLLASKLYTYIFQFIASFYIQDKLIFDNTHYFSTINVILMFNIYIKLPLSLLLLLIKYNYSYKYYLFKKQMTVQIVLV